jgi:hypothetical protein
MSEQEQINSLFSSYEKSLILGLSKVMEEVFLRSGFVRRGF